MRWTTALLLLCISASAQSTLPWKLTRSAHFELYSQGDDVTAPSALAWFEQLRAFYLQKTGLDPAGLLPVRVIRFHSAQDYQPYRLRPASDAHYIGTESRDYIVMAAVDAGQFGTAAHEYAHSILRAAGLRFPPWFGEGLAEFFSTLHIGERGCTLGGDLPARSQSLQRHTWIPLPDLLALPADSPIRENRDTAGMFYAQSWALADMLVLSPDYGQRFSALIAALSSGTPGAEALPNVYGKSLEAITRDLHAWTAKRRPPAALPGIQVQQASIQQPTELSPFQARALMGEMLLAAGDLSRSESIYRDLSRESPRDPAIFAALGTIALRKGDQDRAREQWKQAISLGIADPTLCYQYAALGEMAGLPEDQLRTALERAVALKPDFDDARYHLALLEKNAGNYDSAIANLRAMRSIAPARAYSYWIAMTDSLIQLDRREEADAASKQAARNAATPSQRAYALQLSYMARTDFGVQFTTAENGRLELSTTRVPHKTADWNPFIEPNDKMRHIEGALREIDCTTPTTRFIVDTPEGPVTLAIPDPAHVQMRNAPPEFTCGPQPPTQVTVDYALSTPTGLIRGMQFKQ